MNQVANQTNNRSMLNTSSTLLATLKVGMACCLSLAVQAAPLDNWHCRNPLPQGGILRSVANGDGRFVAVGDAGAILTSVDGAAWTARPSGTFGQINAVIFA